MPTKRGLIIILTTTKKIIAPAMAVGPCCATHYAYIYYNQTALHYRLTKKDAFSYCE